MSKIIVSLTSYPQRMELMPRIISALNNQTVKPDKIVLYLAEEEFNGCKDRVDESFLNKNNTTVRWVHDNFGPYKKFIYAFKEFKNDIVVTVDDDVEYAATMLEDLLTGADKFPNAVIARRARLITSTDAGNMEDYENWHTIAEEVGLFADIPRFDLLAIGMGGVLYHPDRFSDEVCRTDLFHMVCPDTDDLWLKLYQGLANIPVVLVARSDQDFEIKKISRNGLYQNRNKFGGNQTSINNIIKFCENRGITEQQINNLIFSKGRIFKSQLENTILTYIYGGNYQKIIKSIADNALSPEKLGELITKSEDIYIYGCGTFGRRLLQLIFDININKNVSFIETDAKNAETVYGIDIIPVKEISKVLSQNAVIILAGSEQNSYSMAKELENIGINQYYSFEKETREYLAYIERIKYPNL